MQSHGLITPLMIKTCLDEYVRKKTEEASLSCMGRLFNRDAEVVRELANFYQRLPQVLEYYLNSNEIISLCKILAKRKKDEKSISGKVLSFLENKIGSKQRFKCLIMLNKINYYNLASHELIMQWPEADLNKLEKKLFDNDYIETICLLKNNNLHDEDIQQWLNTLTEDDLLKINEIIKTLDKYDLLNIESLPLFFDADHNTESGLLRLLDDADYHDDTYENRYILFEEFLSYSCSKLNADRFDKIRMLITAYREELIQPIYFSFDIIDREDSDINKLFISLKKLGVRFDYALITYSSFAIVNELDHLNSHHRLLRFENAKLIINKYSHEISRLYFFEQLSLQHSVIPFFSMNETLLDSVADRIKKNPIPVKLYRSLFQLYQANPSTMLKLEHFLLMDNICKSLIKHKNNPAIKKMARNEEFMEIMQLDTEVEFVFIECTHLLKSVMKDLSKKVIKHLIENEDAILVIAAFRLSDFQHYGFDAYVSGRIKIIETKKMLIELRKSGFAFFQMPEDLINKISGYTSGCDLAEEGMTIARNVV